MKKLSVVLVQYLPRMDMLRAEALQYTIEGEVRIQGIDFTASAESEDLHN